MKHQPVTVFTKGVDIAIDPFPVKVQRGDTLSWKSKEGKITVAFTDAPLDALHFSAERDGVTKLARVRDDAIPGNYDCTLTLDGKQAKVYGIEIEPGP
jgi:hypothetical protein